MKMNWLLFLLLSLPLSASAQAVAPEPPPGACGDVLAKHVDDNLNPMIEADCDSTAYYFGIGRDKDYSLARSCAYLERFKHVDQDGSLFTGPGILAMVFANGDGTPRDLDLARRFTCEIKEAAPEETLARLAVLDRMAATPKNAGHFDLCSTSKSGVTQNWCASIELRLKDARRYDELVKMVDGLTPQQQESFKVLQTAEQGYEAEHAEKEIDLTGTAAAALTLQERNRIRALFVSDFALFAKKDFAEPVSLGVIQTHIDDDLASIQKIGPRVFRNTTLTVSGVQDTQAAWVKYVAAWRAYEAAVNPGVSGDAVETQLGRERLFHLHRLNKTY
jgi:hypothetical protein